MKKTLCFIVSLIMMLCMSVPSFAGSDNTLSNPSTLEEAKSYLLNYYDVSINQVGKEVRTTYEFSSEEDLNAAAMYIVENGLSAFNEKLNLDLENSLKNNQTSVNVSEIAIPFLQAIQPIGNIVAPLESSPTSVTKTISGNGTHSVSGTTYGMAYFDNLGTGSYTATISYKVLVSGGKISKISSGPSFSYTVGFPATMSINDISWTKSVGNYKVSVAAKYNVVKTAVAGWVTIRSETDTDVFGVAAKLD